MTRLNMPVGVSGFEKLRERNYFYIDKTELIEQILSSYSKKAPTSKVGDGKYNGKENSMQGDHPGILFFLTKSSSKVDCEYSLFLFYRISCKRFSRSPCR